MKPPCGRPCKDCPWRRSASAGWLGPQTAEEWVQTAHSDAPVACHLTIPDTERESEMTTCSGAAIYRSNVAKMPRGVPLTHKLPADRETVFSSPMQFIEHHERKS